MQRGMVDLLTVVAARRGDADLADWVSRTSAAIGFHASPLAVTEAALARGELAPALAAADQVAQGAARQGQQRGRLIALEWGLQARAGLQRWDEILERADAAIGEAEAKSFRTRLWRMLAWRARARAATGDETGAKADRAAACALLDDMTRRITDPVLRAAFETDAVVAEVRQR
jgi:hypothetical protein